MQRAWLFARSILLVHFFVLYNAETGIPFMLPSTPKYFSANHRNFYHENDAYRIDST